MYKVIDIQTKQVIKTFSETQGRQARAYAHRKDAAYGAVRFVVRFEANQQ